MKILSVACHCGGRAWQDEATLISKCMLCGAVLAGDECGAPWVDAPNPWRNVPAVNMGQRSAFPSLNANVSDNSNRGLTEDVLIAAINAAADSFLDHGPSIAGGATPSPRSCPTCGPCPGGPGSTPLNETDKSCWRCGRTDLT